MKHIFEQATSQEEANGKALEETRVRVAGLERQVQEKDDQVALLTGQIAELEKHIQESPAAPPPPPSEDELAKLADELEKERCSLAQDRRTVEQEKHQLQEDEEALMTQMREMEVQMAKERAELARQRTDLQRLHAEVKHELELLQRGDGALKDRLAQFQRRHQSVFERNGHTPEAPPQPAAPAAPAAPPPVNGRTDSGLMRRFFGRS
jgi:peptidoglycan hydrolase CwlO-like protein